MNPDADKTEAADSNARNPRGSTGRRHHWRGRALGLLVVLLIGGGIWWWLHRKPSAAAPAPPLRVQVTTVNTRQMPVILQSVGKVVAQNSVEVRPQTGGVVRRVWIADGERVKAGQRLFTVEDASLNATLAQAKAQFVRDQALAEDARASAARLKPLADKEYVTAREYESAVNTQRSLEATAAATRTQIEQARIALGYASVTAPISGRAGAVLVKPGALVTANNATALLVINVMSPVDISFTLPQASLDRLRRAMAQAPDGRLRIEARESLSQRLRAVGELVFMDNTLDATTGTISLKARFSNADETLWPGEFCAVRITLAVDDAAVVVPESALQQGQDGPFVYVVSGGKADVRKLKTDRVVDGLVVIASGLRAGETVITAVPANLRNGSTVQAVSNAQSAAGVASASAGGAASSSLSATAASR